MLKSELIERAVQKSETPGCRVIVEKPFGRDLASARALNELIGGYLHESQIYRIDHYLGRETVQNILVLRFGNSIFEPIWNRNHVDYVEITAAEEIGIEGRGAFYEQTGVLRDVVQNHLLQLLALIAMEPPAGGSDPDPVRDKKLDLFRSIPEADPARCVRGQYDGYLDEPGVASMRASLRAFYDYKTRGFDHRSRVFEWQLLSSRLIFVLVIAIVAVGLYFSWLQFMAGFKQGTPPDKTSTTFEASPSGIKVSSPVLGVIILTLSLVFFYLYLVHVYPIDELF